ncbi:MAG: hypothetical protein ABSD64_11085 [Terriglobales bacterium]|jgi:hypothetical protein
MKCIYFAFVFLCLTATFLLSQSNPVPLVNRTGSVVASASASQPDPKAQARILESYGKLPLSFEANHGQADSRVKFLSHTGGYSLFLTGDEAVLEIQPSAVSRQVSGIRRRPSAISARTARCCG